MLYLTLYISGRGSDPLDVIVMRNYHLLFL